MALSSPTVNKAELAHWLRVSLPTLGRWMLRYGADFPVIERGTNGRDYAFDPQAVATFLEAKRQEQEQSRGERDEQLAQLRLALDLPTAEPPPKTATTKDEIEAWRLRRLKREEAERAAQLVPADGVADALRAALGRLSRDMHAFVRQIGREQNWPDAYTRAVETRLAEQQRASVASLRTILAEPDDAPARRAV